VGKNKLRKFAEINSFSNVIQPQSEFTTTHFQYKGKWNEAYFGNNNPIILEIGCGKGEYTTGLARAFPEKNFIGIDIKGDRIWKGASDALNQGLHNVAFLRIQAQHIESFFQQKEVAGIWLTFPDPQSGKAREKKRLTSPWFLDKYRSILIPGSTIHLKTDNAGLFEYTLAVIEEGKHTVICRSTDLYSDTRISEPYVKSIQTFYEKQFLDEGKAIHYLKFFLHDRPNEHMSFFQKVYSLVHKIPFGRVSTYGAIAACLGSKGSSRMVGWAMNQSHQADPGLPAHRVVNRQGMLTGKHHFGGSHVMQQLLENEGIKIKDDQVLDFHKKFWDPGREV